MTSVWTVLVVSIVVTQVAVVATSIYLHRALAHRSLVHPWPTWPSASCCGCDRAEPAAVGGGPPQAPHLHRSRGRSAQPAPARLLAASSSSTSYYYMREARNPETLETFAPDLGPDRLDRLLFSHGWTGLGARHWRLLCWLIGWWQGIVADARPRRPYVFVIAPLINGARALARRPELRRTPRTTRGCWPGSPAARACTTTITPSRARRSSACAARSSIPRGRSSARWRPRGCWSSRGRRWPGRASAAQRSTS